MQCIGIIILICMYILGIKFQQSRLDFYTPMYKSEFDVFKSTHLNIFFQKPNLEKVKCITS